MLSANHAASLACVHDNRPYVVPISYAFDRTFIYSFSREGKKLAFMTENKSISLHVVEHRSETEWKSVVVDGAFEEFTADPYFDHENDYAWKALQKRADWWEPGSLKPVDGMGTSPVAYIYYCIRIEAMTGRAARDDTSAIPRGAFHA